MRHSYTPTTAVTAAARKVLSGICLLMVLFAGQTYGQVTFTSWHHPPEVTLYAADSSAGVGTSSTITLDDVYSSIVDLGFTFNFYGHNYTQCVIAANGKICFDTTLAAQFDSWNITQALLGSAQSYNSVCGPFCDMYIPAGGQITYFTYGTAPNRKFVVSYCHDAMFSCTTQFTTTQIILYEGTNVAEVHIGNKTSCTGWNGGYAIVGVQNATGTTATTAPGRDFPAVWTASNEAWQFTPDALLDSYAVSSIPYSPVPYYTIYWYDSVTGTYLGSGDSLVLTPTVTTVYRAAAISCSDTSATGLDTTDNGFVALVPPGSTGVNHPALITQLSLYPNPALNELNITCDAMISHVTISDLLGQTIMHQTVGSVKATVSVQALPPGMYLIKVNGTTTRKFVKQ